MATIQKRGKKWRVRVCYKGVHKSATKATRKQAEVWAYEIEQQVDGGWVEGYHTVEDALDRYAREVCPTHKGERWELLRIGLIKRYPIASELLSTLNPTHVATYRDKRLTEVSAASVNRELNLLSACLNTARIDWRWIRENPISAIRRPKNPPPRNRRITDGEVDAICAKIDNDDVRDMFLLALESAMRLGEMCKITKADINGDYVTLHDTKNGEDRHVPLTTRAKELIREFDITPALASKKFSKAVGDAKIADLTFHDSRHEATFRLAQKIKNPMDLAKITGHKDLKILLNVYYSPSAEDLAALLK